MIEMAILRTVIDLQRVMNCTVRWLSFLRNAVGEDLYIPGGVLCDRSLVFKSLCGFRFQLYTLRVFHSNFFTSSPPQVLLVLGGWPYLAH